MTHLGNRCPDIRHVDSKNEVCILLLTSSVFFEIWKELQINAGIGTGATHGSIRPNHLRNRQTVRSSLCGASDAAAAEGD